VATSWWFCKAGKYLTGFSFLLIDPDEEGYPEAEAVRKEKARPVVGRSAFGRSGTGVLASEKPLLWKKRELFCGGVAFRRVGAVFRRKDLPFRGGKRCTSIRFEGSSWGEKHFPEEGGATPSRRVERATAFLRKEEGVPFVRRLDRFWESCLGKASRCQKKRGSNSISREVPEGGAPSSSPEGKLPFRWPSHLRTG